MPAPWDQAHKLQTNARLSSTPVVILAAFQQGQQADVKAEWIRKRWLEWLEADETPQTSVNHVA